MQVEPYLSFEGCCEEALRFYSEAIGAKVEYLMRFRDAPQAGATSADCESMASTVTGDKVMHASLRIGDSTIMASDGQCRGNARFDGIALTLQADDDAHAERVFAALSAGGQVQMPLAQTFFASRFGMLADRFGVAWMIISRPAPR
jgi:PhnB protein